jgi:hypothetical protein
MHMRSQNRATRADPRPSPQLKLPQLELVKEAKLTEILGASAGTRLEASGVLATGDALYVIFDNSPYIARIGAALSPQAGANSLIEQSLIKQEERHSAGYEDIAYDPSADRYFTLIEALPRGRGTFMAKVQEYDAGFSPTASRWLDFPLDRPNKGLEGLTCIHREGHPYLLGLCEGNRCAAGAAGRVPGGGRIQVFGEGTRRWDHVGTIRLPEAVRFEDYSSITVHGDRIALLSQATSALWVGTLAPSSLDVAEEGTTYGFPRDDDGKIIYCTVEGVSWAAPDRVVVVSDRAKKETQHKRCRAKDQSIHIFQLPDTTSRPARPAATPRRT